MLFRLTLHPHTALMKLPTYIKRKVPMWYWGGLHVSALPQEALKHADTVIVGPAEDSWPKFLEDYRKGTPQKIYYSSQRTLENLPMPRRDLIKNNLYLVPNSLVVSRGCPHNCDFCYKENFFKGGKSFYVQKIDRVLEEIDSFPGRHLFFLDDHLFGNKKFAMELFTALRGMNRVWQAAGTVKSILDDELFEAAVYSGMSSLFIGFETLNNENLLSQNKKHNNNSDYELAIKRMHDNGVMINGSFIFGLDNDDATVFDRTVEWTVRKSIETATFHILTPYPGTKLYDNYLKAGRMTSHNWDEYDTRHVVFKPIGMSAKQLREGYLKAYNEFYSWKNIFQSAFHKDGLEFKARHLAYSAGWKKFEFFWEYIIRRQRIYNMIPLLEKLLSHQPGRKEEDIPDEIADIEYSL